MQGQRSWVWWLAGGAGIAGVVIAGIVALGVLILDYRKEAKIRDDAAVIARMVELPAAWHQARFDAVRTFINTHSKYDQRSPAFAALRDSRQFLAALVARGAGDRDTLVPMECATRTSAMSRVLASLGYRTRRVSVFDTDKEGLSSHTFLQVLNPATDKWETQDPTLGVYWRDKATGDRASVFMRAETAPTALEPCTAQGCGWTKKATRLVRDKLDILTLTDKGAADARRSVYTSRASPAGPFIHKGERGSFCKVMAKRCADGFGPSG